NSSPTYRWAVALHTIEVGVSLPIFDESCIFCIVFLLKTFEFHICRCLVYPISPKYYLKHP
ncbi:hypothetical protein, partial [Caldibacillus thermoamylovorans]|uniref:hypothetical protein n=1 Tax=Caldibacillus thermoamylovorans TaxID=35841 RepID=UPI001F323004